jgi:hypothetical protein
MDNEELINHLKRLLGKVRPDESLYGTHSEICEFLRIYTSPKNTFLDAIKKFDPHGYSYGDGAGHIRANIQSLLDSIQAGVHTGVSPERQAELDVVSDFLEMANQLLDAPKVHPAAACVLIGATLEEFLRTWIEAEGLSLGNKKPGLETYSQILREAELISKQDGKDITAWAGVRNHAAHGQWDEVSDKKRISLMLEGVNLFMRKYSP